MKMYRFYLSILRQGYAAAAVAALGLASGYAADTIHLASDISPLVSQSTVTSPTDQNKLINVVLALKIKDPEAVAQYAEHVNTPHHPLYGQYLTPEQFGEKFGVSPAEYEALIDWAKNEGLTVHEPSKGRTTLTVRGTVAQFERVFKTVINNYRTPDGREFFSASIAPSAPPELSALIQSVIGLSDYNKLAPLVRIGKKLSEPLSRGSAATDTAGGTGPGGAYSAADLRTAYGIPYPLSIPQKIETLAVFEQGGFYQSDVDTYLQKNHLPSVPVKARGVNGFGNTVNDPNVELEAVLDIDAAIGINPALKKVVVYEDGVDSFAVALDDALVAMANDNIAQVISISYGTDEIFQGTAQMQVEGPLFQQLAAQGQSVFVSSGDYGAYGQYGLQTGGSYNVSDPASQPFVTAVGGTTLFTGPNEAYSREIVWNDFNRPNYHGASGGGVSSFWTIPSWQGLLAVQNGGSATMRNLPDVSAVGDPDTGFAVYSAINGGWLQVGGTSLSSPIWAAYAGLIDAAQRSLQLGRVGLLSQKIFAPGQNPYYTIAYGLNDIVDGSNGDPNFGLPPYHPGYSAGFDYDNCTGFGSPTVQFLKEYLMAPLTTGATPAVPQGVNASVQGTTVTVNWAADPNTNGYIILTGGGAFGFYSNQRIDVALGTKVVFQNLLPNTTYTFALWALNAAGPSREYTFYITTGK